MSHLLIGVLILAALLVYAPRVFFVALGLLALIAIFLAFLAYPFWTIAIPIAIGSVFFGHGKITEGMQKQRRESEESRRRWEAHQRAIERKIALQNPG
jgi:membrane protein implicated in regulation of membrane protease activity